MDTNGLGGVLGFDAQDLAANRAGRLSPRQIRGNLSGFILLLLVGDVVLLPILILAVILSSGALLLPALIVYAAITLLIGVRMAFSLKGWGAVQQIRGVIQYFERPDDPDQDEIQVGGLTLALPKAALALGVAAGQPFIVYYRVENGENILLSLEAV